MDEYKSHIESSSIFDKNTDLSQYNDVYGLIEPVKNAITDLLSSDDPKVSLEILKFLATKHQIEDDCYVESPFKYAIDVTNDNTFRSSEIFMIFLNNVDENNIANSCYALKILCYITCRTSSYSGYIFSDQFLQTIFSFVNQENNNEIIKYIMILLYNSMDGFEEKCLNFLPFFLNAANNYDKYKALFIEKIFPFLPEDYCRSNVEIFDFVISCINERKEQTFYYAFRIINKAYERKDPFFIEQCIAHRQWELFESCLLQSQSLSRYITLGYNLMEQCLTFLPTEIIAESPIIHLDTIREHLIKYNSHEGDENYSLFRHEAIIPLLHFIKEYIEVFPFYINELFVEEEVQTGTDENIYKPKAIDLISSSLSGGEFCVTKCCAQLMTAIILKCSGSQLFQLSNNQIVSGFLKIISVSSDDSIFLMLSALHRLFKFLAPPNGIETIRYEYDACDCYEILEDLIQSENEDVSQEAERLLHEIYDVE